MQNMLMKRYLTRHLLLILALSNLCAGQTLSANDDLTNIPEEVIRYQEVFFHFYRKDEFSALVNLSSGLRSKKILQNKFSNELLLGNLYSMYGLSHLADKSLTMVGSQSDSKRQRSLAWFYLAKQYFDQGDYRRFLSLISDVNNDLPENLHDEKRYMLGMTSIQNNRFSEVEKVMNKMNKDSDWFSYLKFNLGTSYLKSGMVEKGEAYIKEIGESVYKTEDMLSLRDKSNIVLGYYYIRAEESGKAISMFENVRLDGPFSNKALLGLGWAYSQQKRFRNALVPWLALAEKDPTNVTVQEAKLASAFAFRQLGADKKALAYYKTSIKEYQEVKDSFQTQMSNSFSHNIFSPLIKDKRIDDYGVSLQIRNELKAGKGGVLVDLLNTEEFQKMFNDYRDLKQLQSKLADWREDLESMDVNSSIQDSARKQMVKGKSRFENRKNISHSENLLTLKDTVQLQSDRIEILIGMYEENIRDEFVRAINVKQQYLTAYLSQARFALAEILDSAQAESQ